MTMMSEAERREKIEAVSAKLRKAAGNLAFKDEQMFAEALDHAFGAKLRAAIDFLHEPEDVDEWADMVVESGREGSDGEEDEDESVPF